MVHARYALVVSQWSFTHCQVGRQLDALGVEVLELLHVLEDAAQVTS